MSLANLKLHARKRKRPINPIEIFEHLTLRGSIENIWGPQQSALKEWHTEFRSNPDNVIQMNTGGGKTLVGLLMAQSLLNEKNGHVLYLCASNQLVEQTVQKATECGFDVASRYAGKWDKKLQFESADMFCITNYDTVFNGFSIFRNKDIKAIVFDDAHVAENRIRSKFTITIKNDSDLFGKIFNLFRSHFASSCQSSQFEDALNGLWNSLVFVPMFIVSKHSQELRRLLIDSGISEDEHNRFPWQHLKNNIGICCILISGGCIQITPSIVPLHKTPYFNDDVKRVYLTATMPSQAGFLRTFGVPQPNIISPRGKSGDAQRLFIFAPGDDDKMQKGNTLELVEDYKSCVISPSEKSAKEWVPPAKIYDTKTGHAGIEEFARSEDSDMLALMARYDGIDLPGNACNVLILDKIPRGVNLFDKFIDQSIQIGTLRSSHTATRITQAIGRIFRSNTDHGVVILNGSDLQGWLTTPRNRALLPDLLQKQLQLGLSLRDQVFDEETSYEELMEAILEGDRAWDVLYKSHIEEYDVCQDEGDEHWYNELLVDERQAYFNLWDGQHSISRGCYEDLAKRASQYDNRLGAWYQHWAGLACQLNKENESALMNFQKAANIRIELGRPSISRDKLFKPDDNVVPSWQSSKMKDLYKTKRTKINKLLSLLNEDLTYGKETNKAEEALKILGTLLGLDCSRPEKIEGTGPDVLWIGRGEYKGVSFELKTNKKQDGEYSKSNIKDAHDHKGWLCKKYPRKTFIETILGPGLKVSPKANPHNDLRIITIDAIRHVLERTNDLYSQVTLSGNTDEHEFERWLRHFGLLWPNCIEALPYKLAIDLKNDGS